MQQTTNYPPDVNAIRAKIDERAIRDRLDVIASEARALRRLLRATLRIDGRRAAIEQLGGRVHAG